MQHPQELFGVLDVVRTQSATAAGVGHDACQVAGRRGGCLDRRLNRRLVGHVGDDIPDASPVAGLDGLLRLGQLRLGAAADRDDGPVGGQRSRTRTTDAGTPARDEDAESGKCSVCHSAMFAHL